MAQITINKTWVDGETPTKADLDNIVDGYETFTNVTQLSSDNIQSNSLTASTVFTNGTITAGKIANGAITTAKILDGAITAGKFMEGAITTAKILDANITTAKIASSTIDPSKFGSGSITPSKLVNAVLDTNTSGTVFNSSTTTPSYLSANATSGLNRYLIMYLSNAQSMFITDNNSITVRPNFKTVLNINSTDVSTEQTIFTGITLFEDGSGIYTSSFSYPASAYKFLGSTTYTNPSIKFGAYLGNTFADTVGITSGSSTAIEVQ